MATLMTCEPTVHISELMESEFANRLLNSKHMWKPIQRLNNTN